MNSAGAATASVLVKCPNAWDRCLDYDDTNGQYVSYAGINSDSGSVCVACDGGGVDSTTGANTLSVRLGIDSVANFKKCMCRNGF